MVDNTKNQAVLLRLRRVFLYWLMVNLFQVFGASYIQGQEAPKVNGIDDVPEPQPAWQDLNYPKSSLLTGVVFDESTHRTEAPGSDIWPITWADDNHQYSAFGDGGGFGGSNSKGRVSMGITRIEGSHLDYFGRNVWGGYHAENPAEFTGKGTGILCVDGVLYMWVAGNASKTVSTVQLAVSKNHSKTWNLVDWNWTIKDGLFAGVFVNCGRDYSDAPDDFVYACFTRLDPPPAEPRVWIYERPGIVDLARCSKGRLEEKDSWEWFAGTDSKGDPKWTSSLCRRQQFFEDPNGIKVVSVGYQPALGRYLLVYTPRDTGGHFALFESRHAWGPWSEVAYFKKTRLFQPPKANSRVSIYHFAPKWWSADGKEFTLVYNVGDDAWNTVRGRFKMK
jgi:hypothetical protein